MIDYKEIRYGNKLLYSYEGDIITVLGYSYSDGVFNDRSSIPIDPEELDPIPLTEEWLIKFGFNLDEGVGVWFGPKYAEPAYYFTLWASYGKHPVRFTRNNPSDTIDILYVHQLQNLYFALTGEELTIEE